MADPTDLPSDARVGGCARCGRALAAGTSDDLCPDCLVEFAATDDPGVVQGGSAGRNEFPEEPAAEAQSSGPRGMSGEMRSEPERLGEYDLLSEIARGGMGVVHRARHRRLKRVVALKTIAPERLASEEAIERFRIEAETAAGLDHPGIVPVFESGEEAGWHYYAMSLVEGRSLGELLQDGPCTSTDAASLVSKLAEAVSYAHGRGVLHRDLKPANILLDGTQPRITDFGLARRLDQLHSLTTSGQVMGTPSYMPPEQAVGDHDAICEQSDIYSLGAILYALLTGGPPFRAATPVDTLAQVLDADPVPPTLLNGSIPEELEAVCLKCLEKTPAQRYSSASALAEDLRRFLVGEPVAANVDASSRFFRFMRRRTRHGDIMQRHARAWRVQAVIVLAMSLIANALLWRGDFRPWVLLSIGGIGSIALLIPGWIHVIRGRGEIAPVEKQVITLWWLFIATVGLTYLVLLILGVPTAQMLPLVMVEFAFALGCTAVVLRGSFYPLAALCALAAPLAAAFPGVGPLTCGLAVSIGLTIAAWTSGEPARRVGKTPENERSPGC